MRSFGIYLVHILIMEFAARHTPVMPQLLPIHCCSRPLLFVLGLGGALLFIEHGDPIPGAELFPCALWLGIPDLHRDAHNSVSQKSQMRCNLTLVPMQALLARHCCAMAMPSAFSPSSWPCRTGCSMRRFCSGKTGQSGQGWLANGTVGLPSL